MRILFFLSFLIWLNGAQFDYCIFTNVFGLKKCLGFLHAARRDFFPPNRLFVITFLLMRGKGRRKRNNVCCSKV